jgi:membrane-associated phospholipid phosphatase
LARVSRQDHQAHAVLIAVLAFYAVTYVALAATGTYVFIFKSVLIPAFAIYALRSGEIAVFVRSWFPFLASTVLFDSIRGAIYTLVELGYRPVFAQYAITLEERVLGTPAISIPLQEHLRSPALDRVMVGIHGAHFVYFLLFGLVVWHVKREWFRRYTWSMVGVFYLGALCYLLIPTAPPWMASRGLGLLPPVDHIAGGIYNFAMPELYGAFDTNPVAAMPSLHAAFPTVCMLIAWAAFPRSAAIGATVYAGIVALSIMYLGEHYFVDVLAGCILAGAVCAIVFWWDPPREPAPLSMAVALSASLLAQAFMVAWVAGR